MASSNIVDAVRDLQREVRALKAVGDTKAVSALSDDIRGKIDSIETSLGITVHKTTEDAPSDNPNGVKGDLWLKYDHDPDTDDDASIVASWWWDGSEWDSLPVVLYLDTLHARGVEADLEVVKMLSAQIIQSGEFRTGAHVGAPTITTRWGGVANLSWSHLYNGANEVAVCNYDNPNLVDDGRITPRWSNDYNWIDGVLRCIDLHATGYASFQIGDKNPDIASLGGPITGGIDNYDGTSWFVVEYRTTDPGHMRMKVASTSDNSTWGNGDASTGLIQSINDGEWHQIALHMYTQVAGQCSVLVEQWLFEHGKSCDFRHFGSYSDDDWNAMQNLGISWFDGDNGGNGNGVIMDDKGLRQYNDNGVLAANIPTSGSQFFTGGFSTALSGQRMQLKQIFDTEYRQTIGELAAYDADDNKSMSLTTTEATGGYNNTEWILLANGVSKASITMISSNAANGDTINVMSDLVQLLGQYAVGVNGIRFDRQVTTNVSDVMTVANGASVQVTAVRTAGICILQMAASQGNRIGTHTIGTLKPAFMPLQTGTSNDPLNFAAINYLSGVQRAYIYPVNNGSNGAGKITVYSTSINDGTFGFVAVYPLLNASV